MTPADAVIGWTDGAGSDLGHVGTYLITDKSPEGITPHPNFQLKDSAIGNNGTGLFLYFSRDLLTGNVPLNGSGSSAVYMNFAFNPSVPGPLSTWTAYHGNNRGSFVLQPYSLSGSARPLLPDRSELAITAGSVTVGAPSTTRSEAAAGLGLGAPAAAPASGSDSASGSAPAPAPAGAIDPCASGNAVTLAGITFHCVTPNVRLAGGPSTAPGVGRLLWTVSSSNASTTTPSASFAITLPTTGWIGLSFTTEGAAGNMVPATGVIGRVLPGGEVDCAAYRLTEYALSGVQRAPELPLITCGVIQNSSNGASTLYFTRPLAASAGPGSTGWVALTSAGPAYINYAFGDTSQIAYHGPNKGSLTLASLQGGGPTSYGSDSSFAVDLSHARTHGKLMSVAYALLLPLGVILGRFIQTGGRPVFYAHVLINFTALVLALAGFIIAITQLGNWRDVSWQHGRVGIAVITLSLAQLVFGFVRPHHTPITWLRKAWELTHVAIGTSAIALGILQIGTGLEILSNEYYQSDVGDWLALVGASLGSLVVLRAVLGRVVLQSDRVERGRQREELETLRAKAWRVPREVELVQDGPGRE